MARRTRARGVEYQTMVWKPNVTVAAVVERDGRFLLVEEEVEGALVLNQPAGHLERGESLLAAAERETLEETAWHFRPEALIGIYRWTHQDKDITFLRFAFTGTLVDHEPSRVLDPDIRRTLWLDAEELRGQRTRHRSPQVMACVNDYLAGRRYSLGCLCDLGPPMLPGNIT
jgi:ADP-ribose pyrophosphatase YjhB (NUDIX family)